MSIHFHPSTPREVVTGDVADERERCALIVEGTLLGYRTGEEHEVLENFARKVAMMIRSGVVVEYSRD